MSRILIVDWLGRGGIAHTTGAWAETLLNAGHDVRLATRPGRELDHFPQFPHEISRRAGRFAAHAALGRVAARAIAHWRPDMVVVQNFVIPPLERPVWRAAVRAGSHLVYVVHDHRLHSPLAGTRVGLRGALQAADEIWTHSHFVGRGVQDYAGRTTRVVPLPVPPALVRAPVEPRSAVDGSTRKALHFGVLKRGYKGTAQVVALARTGVPGWRFQLLGVGAPASEPGIETIPRFLQATELTAAVSAADAVLLPYRIATQSASVVLAQALGAIPVASAVGGIPEQIGDGVDGVLMPIEADLLEWRQALVDLSRDPEAITAMGKAAAERVWEGHRAFTDAVTYLPGS